MVIDDRIQVGAGENCLGRNPFKGYVYSTEKALQRGHLRGTTIMARSISIRF
jgi:hypothetical protein